MPLFGERVCLTLGEQSSIELDVLASIWFDIIPTLQYQWETCTQLSIATGKTHWFHEDFESFPSLQTPHGIRQCN